MDIRIGRDSEFEAFDKVTSELTDQLEPGAELAIEGGPAHFDIPPDGMQSVREPDVDIDRHRARADRAERALADWHRMLAERAVELLVQQHAILPEPRLVARHASHGDAAVDEPAVAHQ